MQLPVQVRSWRQMLQQAAFGYQLCGNPGEVPPESIARRPRTATGIVKELGGYDSLDPADQLFWHDALMRERRARECHCHSFQCGRCGARMIEVDGRMGPGDVPGVTDWPRFGAPGPHWGTRAPKWVRGPDLRANSGSSTGHVFWVGELVV